MLAQRCLELGTLLFHEVLQVVRFLHRCLDTPSLIVQLFGLCLLVALLLLLQFGAHLSHPLFLHHLHAQVVAFGFLGLALQEDAAPDEHAQEYDAQEDDHNPTVAQQRRGDGNLEGSLVLAHGTILVEHAHMQDIVAMVQ